MVASSHSSYPDLSILSYLDLVFSQKSVGIFSSSRHSPNPAKSLLSIPFPTVGHSFPNSVLGTCLSVPVCFELPVATEPVPLVLQTLIVGSGPEESTEILAYPHISLAIP